MVIKVSTNKLMSVKLPVDLKDRIDDCRTEYARQGLKISVNGAIVKFLERETKAMEKELRLKNPNFEAGQTEMEV